eukprot:1143198-Pelagomonas_calceolata.AAC.3
METHWLNEPSTSGWGKFVRASHSMGKELLHSLVDFCRPNSSVLNKSGVRAAWIVPPAPKFVTVVPTRVKPGDKILYFKYAGDNMETPDGHKYVVLREDDILCKA